MKVLLNLDFDEDDLVRLAKWLVETNCHRLMALLDFPLLYSSGTIYQTEAVETWQDAPSVLVAGHEDCDSLSCWRAAELLVRGWKALRPWDPGYVLAKARQTPSIKAEVYFTASHARGETGTYHCLVRYQVGGVWYTDDPSAQLGMYSNQIDPLVWEQWRAANVLQPTVLRWADRGVRLESGKRRAA